MKINRQKFEKFQNPKVLNVIERISKYTGLTREELGEIIKNYPKYDRKLKEELGYEVKT